MSCHPLPSLQRWPRGESQLHETLSASFPLRWRWLGRPIPESRAWQHGPGPRQPYGGRDPTPDRPGCRCPVLPPLTSLLCQHTSGATSRAGMCSPCHTVRLWRNSEISGTASAKISLTSSDTSRFRVGQ